MMMNIVDSHCHLDQCENTEAAIQAAFDNGVEYLLNVCIDLDNFPKVLSIAESHSNISASVGIHPNVELDSEPTIEHLMSLADNKNIIAIGETGLDYFRSEGNLDWQRDRFKNHIEVSRQTNLPLIIHSRDAKADTVKILKEQGRGDVTGVIHCFTEDWEMAQACMDLNFYISFSGIVTFKNAKVLQDVALKMPLDRILIETDSPYLAPMPHRGKTNQPAYVRHVAEFLAELRGESIETIAKHTTQNFYNLFNKATPCQK